MVSPLWWSARQALPPTRAEARPFLSVVHHHRLISLLPTHHGGVVEPEQRALPLLAFAGIKNCLKVEPVMSEEFHLRFASETDAENAADCLRNLRVGGQQAMQVERRETNVYVWRPL